MIKYDKMFSLLKEKGYTAKRIREENLISQSTITNINKGLGGLSHENINKLCTLLHCSPSDLMEFIYVPEEEQQYLNGDRVKARGIHKNQGDN